MCLGYQGGETCQYPYFERLDMAFQGAYTAPIHLTLTTLETREIQDPTWSFCRVERTLKTKERHKHFQDPIEKLDLGNTHIKQERFDFLNPRKSQ
jgi:hypothetical protein